MFLMVLGIIALLVGACVSAGFKSQNKQYASKQYDKRKPAALPLAIGIIVCLICVITPCIKTVPTGHTGIVTTFGKVDGVTLDAGVHFLAPWKKVVNMDNRIQKVTVDMESTTKDMQTVSVTFTLNYEISKTNASEIYKTIGVNYEDTVISAQITNTVKSVMAKYAATALVTDRSGVSREASTALTDVLKQYNIEVVNTSIENLGFTDAFNTSIENKVIAEQELEKAQTEQEKLNLETEQEAQRKVTEAQGTADANKILADSYTPEILQKMFLEKWNGELPAVMGSTDTMFDISSYINEAETE